MKKMWSFVVTGLSVVLCLSATAAQDDNSLLAQSYNLSQTLKGSERVFYLSELTRIAAQVDPPPDAAEEWCLSLFRVATAEKDQLIRIAGQKNALAHLSYLDPPMAVSLFPNIEIERPDATGMLWEDLRSDAATEVFTNYLVKVKPNSLTLINTQAKYLGETGQYPYRAMASVIAHLPPVLMSEANGIVTDAVNSYLHERGFYNRDEEFLEFIKELNTHGTGIDSQILNEAITAFVHRVSNDAVVIPGDYYGELHDTRTGAVVSFTDRNRAFLFQAFPLVHKYNLPLATQLAAEQPQIAQMTDDMKYVSGGFVTGDPTSANAARKHLEWVQDSLISRIDDEVKNGNSQSALGLAQRLADQRARIIGFSALVPQTARQNPVEGYRIFSVQLANLKSLSSARDKLPAMAALAQAACHVGDLNQYHKLSIASVETAVNLISSNAESGSIRNVEGFEDLQKLVSFISRHPDNDLKRYINALPSSWLKAYLLLYEASGRLASPASASSQVCPS